MGWPIISGGGGGGGGGGGASGVPFDETTGSIEAMGTEDLDVDISGFEVGDLVDVAIERTAGASTRVALQILDSDGNSLNWPIGSQFGDVDASSAVDGPRVFVSGANYYLPQIARSSSDQLHLRVHNRDNGEVGTFNVTGIVRPVTTA